jgi:hypothetical protein
MVFRKMLRKMKSADRRGRDIGHNKIDIRAAGETKMKSRFRIREGCHVVAVEAQRRGNKVEQYGIIVDR